MNANVNAITFTRQSRSTIVVANRYIPYAIYKLNKTLVAEYNGELMPNTNVFTAKFKTVKDANAFLKVAVTSISKDEYNDARKTKSDNALTTKPKAEGAKRQPISVRGNSKPSSVKSAIEKAQSNEVSTSTDGNKNPNERDRLLEKMKVSALNRAAAKHDRANGGNGLVTFATYGKTVKELKEYMPAAIDDTLKAKKFHDKAIKLGITKEMLSK